MLAKSFFLSQQITEWGKICCTVIDAIEHNQDEITTVMNNNSQANA
jgi:hypothetical protein